MRTEYLQGLPGRSHMTKTRSNHSCNLLSTTIIMDAKTTIGTNNTNNTNNMSIIGLNPARSDLLQVISVGSLSALEVIAVSGDTFPPLKAAVVEALAIIGIIQVCCYFNHFITSIYMTALEIQDQQKRLGCFF